MSDSIVVSRSLTPKQRRRAVHKANGKLAPAKAPKVKRPFHDPWGTGKPVPVKPHFQRPATECLHVLAVHKLVDAGSDRLVLHTGVAYCRRTGKHAEHRGDGRSWS